MATCFDSIVIIRPSKEQIQCIEFYSAFRNPKYINIFHCIYILVSDTYTGAAKIVKHFKILVTCFSARVSRSAGIWT